ncbi:MAG: ABC transporter [Pseudomonadaceae bacterium]|nr:MAG: ABC transporter [Pseudomonadaceae bacterium]
MHDWFLLPLVNGLLTTLLLTLAGVGLLLRGSVWQVFAVSQWAAVGGVLASVLAVPVLLPALLLAALALVIQRRWRDAERLSLTLFLAGLAVITLLAANISQASLAAARWVDGQLYFTGVSELIWIAALVVLSGVLLPQLRRVWLWAQRQPDVSAQPGPAWYWRVLELAWLVLVIVVGAQALGVPGAMATLLLPAWAAARVAHNLAQMLVVSQLLALLAFVIAWVTSLWLDQPFAPMLVLIQLGLMGLLIAGQKLHASAR